MDDKTKSKILSQVWGGIAFILALILISYDCKVWQALLAASVFALFIMKLTSSE